MSWVLRVNIYMLGKEKSEKKYNDTREGRHVPKDGFPRKPKEPGRVKKTWSEWKGVSMTEPMEVLGSTDGGTTKESQFHE